MKKRIFFFILSIALATISWAQNLEFSYVVVNNGATTDINVSVQSVSGTENLAAFTMVFYYDNSQSSLASTNPIDVSSLPWGAFDIFATPFQTRNNSSIPTGHNGYIEVNISDLTGAGSDFGPISTPVLSVTFDNVGGGSDFYMASAVEHNLGLIYVSLGPVGGGFPIVVNQGGAFPVEWLDFDATPDRGQVLTKWSTATEINNDYFVVERSQDGEHFEAFAEVPAAGNSSETQTYQTWDASPYMGRSLYRVKQVDLDGSFSYTHQVEVFFGADLSMVIYPNPAEDQAWLDLEWKERGTLHLEILDGQGRVVQTQDRMLEPGMQHIPIDAERLPEGFYTVKAQMPNQTASLRLIVK